MPTILPMAAKRGTRAEAEQARRSAVDMFERFGNDARAAEFRSMSTDEYIAHSGWVLTNPGRLPASLAARLSTKTTKGTNIMALKVSEWEQLNGHINTRASEALQSNSRAEMREALEEIEDLTAEDTDLIFNDDGTVELAEGDAPEDQDDED